MNNHEKRMIDNGFQKAYALEQLCPNCGEESLGILEDDINCYPQPIQCFVCSWDNQDEINAYWESKAEEDNDY